MSDKPEIDGVPAVPSATTPGSVPPLATVPTGTSSYWVDGSDGQMPWGGLRLALGAALPLFALVTLLAVPWAVDGGGGERLLRAVGEIVVPLLTAFLLGWLVMGWLTWRWRRTRVTATQWASLNAQALRVRQQAAQTGSIRLDGDDRHTRSAEELAAIERQLDLTAKQRNAARAEIERLAALGRERLARIADVERELDAAVRRIHSLEDELERASDDGPRPGARPGRRPEATGPVAASGETTGPVDPPGPGDGGDPEIGADLLDTMELGSDMTRLVAEAATARVEPALERPGG